MTFTFLHTADWQIGKPFGSFPDDKAALLREARKSVITRIAQVARENGAAHVLVAGDVFDSRDVPDRDLMQSVDRMRREANLTWHLLPGNHDAAYDGSIWERLARVGVPENVRPHLEPGPVNLAPDVVLLPAPLRGRTTVGDPTAWMDTAATPAARYRIGLAHGSIHGFGGEGGEAAVPIAPGRAEKAGLSYLALGDWHGALRISDRAWYSGTPEPDRFPDNEPGFVLVVQLDNPGGPPKVERHPTAQYTWLKRMVDATEPTHVDQLLAQLQAHANPEHLLVSLAVSGTPSLAGWGKCEAQFGSLDQRLFHLQVNSAAVTALPEVIELEEFGAGDLGQTAELLSGMARDPANSQAAAASLALRKLYGMVQQIRAGGRA
jgi:hypothetical protein